MMFVRMMTVMRQSLSIRLAFRLLDVYSRNVVYTFLGRASATGMGKKHTELFSLQAI